MELNIQKSHIQGTDAIKSFGFTIKADPKAFHLLIAQLYKDRIAAFIRELSTNAYEAHQMLGIETKPFEVTLPTLFTQSFKIRDFGPGLSVEQVASVYTTIFESTKTDSNEMGGCFGLGSKSPFAYADNFGVISYHGGMKYCYSVFKDEEGYPKMNLLHQEPSNEFTGIEVSIPVSKNDFHIVEIKAREIYKWFVTPPTCVNGRPFEKCMPETKGTNFGHYSPRNVSRASARMGNILYSIDSSLCNLHHLQNYPIVVEFPIGTLTPEPSREGLSFDKKTKRAIEEAFGTIKQEFIDRIQPKVTKALDYHEAVLIARELISNSPVILNELKWNGKVLNSHLGYLPEEIGLIKCVSGDKLKKGYSHNLEIDRDSVFFVIDKKCSYQQIIKQHVANAGLNRNKIFVCDEIYSKHDRAKFIEFFKIDPSRVLVISQVPYTPTPRQKGIQGNKHLTKMFTWKYSTLNAYSWEDIDIDITTNKGMYVVYFNNKILNVDGKEISPDKLKGLIDLIGYKGIVYGVKKDTVDKLTKSGNWTSFLDYAKPLAYNVMKASSAEDAEVAAKIIQAFRYERNSSHPFVEAIAKINPNVLHVDVKNAVDEYKKIHSLSLMDYRTMGQIATHFYNESLVNIGSTKSLDRGKYGKLLSVLDKKFPLLTSVKSYDNSTVNELVHYITLKDI